MGGFSVLSGIVFVFCRNLSVLLHPGECFSFGEVEGAEDQGLKHSYPYVNSRRFCNWL
jgi:hypothetical protein